MEFSVVIKVEGFTCLHEFVKANTIEEAAKRALENVADQCTDFNKTVISVIVLP